MQAKVENVSPDGDVTLASAYGVAIGKWQGKLPVVGQAVNVELDYDQIEFIEKAVNPAPRLEGNGKVALLAGILERDLEGSACLRLGQDVVLLDCDELTGQLSDWVQLGVTHLKFFDKNL